MILGLKQKLRCKRRRNKVGLVSYRIYNLLDHGVKSTQRNSDFHDPIDYHRALSYGGCSTPSLTISNKSTYNYL